MNNCLLNNRYSIKAPLIALRKKSRSWPSYGLLLIICIISIRQAAAQPTASSYATMVIDTLASATMNGRGYVDSADWKAAVFIRQSMEAEGLQPFYESYFQQYPLNVNAFPGAMELKVDGTVLTAGKDFLVDAASGSCNGKFATRKINRSITDTTLASVYNLCRDLSGRNNKHLFLLVQKENFTAAQYAIWQKSVYQTNAFGAAGVVEYTDNKLTWHASQEQFSWCALQVKGSLPAAKKTEITVDIESEWKKNYSTQNVIAYVKGTSVPDSFFVFTAHYDHLGQMGDGTYFPGANDNASGTSLVMNLAKYYAAHPMKYSVAFMFFSGEELGLLGSQYYVNHPLFPLSKIKFLVNLDIVGTGDEGIKVVNATEFPLPFKQLVTLNDNKQLLKVVSPRGKAANSDHYSFYEKGVPCFFIYTMGGIAAYHDIYDRAETLPLTGYDNLFQLLTDFTNTF